MDTCIVGIGNELRGDDGVGPAVVIRMQNGALGGIGDFFNLGTDVFALTDLIRKYRRVFIIDALPPGPKPGRVTFFLRQDRLIGKGNLFSLHDLDLLWQLQVVHEFDSKIWLVGIETASLEWNPNLSPEIKARLDMITKNIGGGIKDSY